jgi:hypothetical protein
MITIRTIADITADRQVVVSLPPETPVGMAELVVTVAPQAQPSPNGGALRKRFGSARSGDGRSADNERIDADLARAYGNQPE